MGIKAEHVISREECGRLYAGLKKHDIKNLVGVDPSVFKKDSRFRKGRYEPLKVASTIGLLGTFAHQLDEETFYNAMISGEIPAVKLTVAEMELIKGGGLPDLVGKYAIIITTVLSLIGA